MATPAFHQVRCFIFDPEDLRSTQIAPWLRWLELHAQEKTRQLDACLGLTSGFRVFVRQGSENEP
jgi:hypothetical protein